MKIDQLPVEILMEILSYLPSYSNVSLVSKHFYNVACKVNDPNICLTLNAWFFESEKKLQLLQSIEKTNRKISKVCIDFRNPTAGQVRSTISIIKKFTKTITCLKIRDLILTMADFLEILSLVPNAIKIRIEYLELRTDSQPWQKKRRLMSDNKDLNLHRLRVLTIHYCNDEFMESVFNRLPVGVLTEFDCHGFSNLLCGILKRQTNLKKLWFYPTHGSSTVTMDIFDNMKLETLRWNINSADQNNMATILSKQTKLKSLDLEVSTTLNEGLMDTVANHLIELESLSVPIPETSVPAFANMIKLKSLKNLTLSSGKVITFKPLLDNTRITTLTLCGVRLNVELINSLAMSLPNLKALQIDFVLDFQILNAILRSFNYVEALSTAGCRNRFEENIHLFIHDDCANLKLLDLTMHYCFVSQTLPVVAFIEKLIRNYPNLHKLTLRASQALNASLLKMILNGFTKMESLVLLFDTSELTIDDLYYVSNQKSHLKFFYFSDFRSKFKLTAERKDKLCAMFNFVRAFKWGIAVASSRNTMKREVQLHRKSIIEF